MLSGVQSPQPDTPLSSLLTDRLALIHDWYQGMVSVRTGRLVYRYDPALDTAVVDGSAVRDIASVWDLELLGSFLGRNDLEVIARRSLEHFGRFLAPRNGGSLAFDSRRLGEPASIAHSAFMLLALADSTVAGKEGTVSALAEGLLHQQRPDGSFRVYFGGLPDEGLEFYPGEAMLALMRAGALLDDPRCLAGVERGFAFSCWLLPPQRVAADLLVFFANWQSQFAVPLHAATHSPELRNAVGEHVFALHDRIVRSGFYADLERAPQRQATVEVACALEGLNDAYTLALRERDQGRQRVYARCIRIAVDWLLGAQRLRHCTRRERGGFADFSSGGPQRIDVTGHVLHGFIKTVRNGLE